MTRSEYEARRRQLDEELRAVLEAVNAGHQARVQLLDLMWGMSSAGMAMPPALSPGAPVAAEPEPRPSRRGPGQLYNAIMAVLSGLPERFTKDDIEKALGERIERATLFRVLRHLEADGWIRTEKPGKGKYPTMYRRLASPESEETP